ncbi:hypothetical protein ACOMHN_053601 [Nucella lapillus]
MITGKPRPLLLSVLTTPSAPCPAQKGVLQQNCSHWLAVALSARPAGRWLVGTHSQLALGPAGRALHAGPRLAATNQPTPNYCPPHSVRPSQRGPGAEG